MPEQVYDLEFNGPFLDWWNVVDDFGADPTGVSDSTSAFQAMLTAMGVYGGTEKNGLYIGYTGYIPNGTYKISDTLTLPNPYTGQPVSGEGVNLWGQDPENVTLKWAGDPGQAILWSDGCHSSTVGRITFDGQGIAGVGFRLERHPDIPVQNSYSRLQDCIFKDVATGFFQTNDFSGDVGLDSEFSIMRCRFYRCSDHGARITKGEAYNYWIRQSYFEDCRIAIGNGPYGAFSAYDNIFARSTEYDIYGTGMRICGIRRNRSFDSNRFLYLNCSNSVIEGNEISNPTETDAVRLENRFKVMILNNKFKSAAEATIGPVINETVNPFSPANSRIAPFAPLFILFNQFTVPNPISIVPETPINNDIQGNLTNPSLTVEMPPIPPFPPQVIRQTYYLDTSNDPQQTVDDAAALALAIPDSQPVVYLPSYANDLAYKSILDKTLIFPANIKMSLQGGGNRTAFRWDPDTRETYVDPYVLFRGPSKVTVQNMQIGFPFQEGGKSGLMAVVDNGDQPGARFYADNCAGIYQFRALTNLKADICDYLIGSYNSENLPFLVSSPSEGTGDSRVLHEGGAGSNAEGNEPFVQLIDGGRYYLREFWYETTNVDKLWADLSGMGGRSGHLSIETSLIEQHLSDDKWNMKMIEATDWWGDILYLDSLIIGSTKLSGEASRANYLSFGGGSPVKSDSTTPATVYRQDGIPFWIIDFWTMDLTQETMENNGGWGIFGSKPDDWQERLWDTIARVPTTWIDILGDELTDMRLHRVRGDFALMADEYTLVEQADLVQTTDFMSAALPSDATFSRDSGAMMFNANPALVWGPENLVVYSQDLANAAWSLSLGGTGVAPVVTANDAVAPDGTMTATKAVFDSGSGTTSSDWSVVNSSPISIPYNMRMSFAFWVKGTAGTQIVFQALDLSDLNYSLVTCNDSWQRIVVQGRSYYGAGDTFSIGVRQGTSSAGTVNSLATVWLWGVQLQRADVLNPYVPTTSTPVYGLRFDHDPLTGLLLGVLNEPESTNAVAYSSVLTGTGWTTNGHLTVSGHGVPSPEIGLDALSLTEDTANAAHLVEFNTIYEVLDEVYGVSCFVKNDSGSRWLQLNIGGAFYVNFQPATGAIGSNSTRVSNINAQQMADGWWRLSYYFTGDATVGTSLCLYLVDSGSAASGASYTGDGTSSIAIWGVQFESPSVGVTSYIPAYGSSTTRSADVLKILRDNGTYDVTIARQIGEQVLTDQVVSDGTFTIPTSTSPVIKVVTRRK